MNYYQDITLLPDADITLGFIWQKVYQQIHLALVENKTDDNHSTVAVGFPKYGNKGFPLGNKLRLFAQSEDVLHQLKIENWLSRLTDYCHIKSIQPVPDKIEGYGCFKRKQFKSNLRKEAQRRAKYKNESLEDALAHFQHYDTECKLPYINMISLSTRDEQQINRKFKLFIEREPEGEMFAQPRPGQFDCYGLSKTATIPWF